MVFQSKLIHLSLALVLVVARSAPARGEQPSDGLCASYSSLILSVTRYLDDLAAQILLSKIGYEGTRELPDPTSPNDVRVLLDSPNNSVLQLRTISVKPRADAPTILEWKAELDLVGAVAAKQHDCDVQQFFIMCDEQTRSTAVYRAGARLKPQGLEHESVWVTQETNKSQLQSPSWVTWVLIGRDSDTEPLRLLGAHTCWVSPHQ